MGNHRTDLGKDFIKSGMTLITDPRSDRYLRKIEKRDEKVENEGVSKKRLNRLGRTLSHGSNKSIV